MRRRLPFYHASQFAAVSQEKEDPVSSNSSSSSSNSNSNLNSDSNSNSNLSNTITITAKLKEEETITENKHATNKLKKVKNKQAFVPITIKKGKFTHRTMVLENDSINLNLKQTITCFKGKCFKPCEIKEQQNENNNTTKKENEEDTNTNNNQQSEVNDLHQKLKQIIICHSTLAQSKQSAFAKIPTLFDTIKNQLFSLFPQCRFTGAVKISNPMDILIEWYFCEIQSEEGIISSAVKEELIKYVQFLYLSSPESLDTNDHILLAESIADLRIQLIDDDKKSIQLIDDDKKSIQLIDDDKKSIIFDDYLALKNCRDAMNSINIKELMESPNDKGDANKNIELYNKWKMISAKHTTNIHSCPHSIVRKWYIASAMHFSRENKIISRKQIRAWFAQRKNIHLSLFGL